jgi:hypothetical protein
MYVLAIVVHATAGVVAFVAGVQAVTADPAGHGRARAFPVYYWALVVMGVGLLVAVGLDWGDSDSGARVLFVVLSALAAFMVWQADRARRILDETSAKANLRRAFVDRVGFTLIALFDGFVIVSAIDLGAPGWAVAVVGVLGVVVGRRVLSSYEAAAEGPP